MRILFGVLLAAAGALPAFADEMCEAEFRTLMRQDNAGFPYAAIIRTEFAGVVTEVPTIVANAEHSMTLNDEYGQRHITKGNQIWLSTDKGKSWKPFTTLPKDTVKKVEAMLARQAVGATEIACIDGVEQSGRNYRLVQGKFTTDNVKLPALQKFYVPATGETWQIAVTEMTIAGKPSVITTTKTKSGNEVTIPDVDQ
jgi:hypothetical protein